MYSELSCRGSGNSGGNDFCLPFYCIQDQPNKRPHSEKGNPKQFNNNLFVFPLQTKSGCHAKYIIWNTSAFIYTKQSRPIAILCCIYFCLWFFHSGSQQNISLATLYFNNSCSQLRSVNRLGRGSGWRYLWCHCVGFSVLPWMWCVISSSWLFLVLDFIVSILGMLRMRYWAEKGREKIDHFGQECLYGKNTLDIHQWDAARKIFLIFLLSWL